MLTSQNRLVVRAIAQLTSGDPDDTLDNVFTKSDGAFRVSGSASELTPIDPEVRIYHDCNDHGKVTFITFEKFLLEEDEKTVFVAPPIINTKHSEPITVMRHLTTPLKCCNLPPPKLHP